MEWIFWLNVPIVLLAIPFVLTRMKESFGPDSSLDIPGLALVSGGALGIVWGLVRGNQAGWGSAEVVASLALGALLVAAFVAWERRAREPMAPMRFFRSRAFSAGNAAIFFTFASLFGAVFFYAQLLQTTMGYSPLEAGLRLLPWTATFITIAPIAGALADRIGSGRQGRSPPRRPSSTRSWTRSRRWVSPASTCRRRRSGSGARSRRRSSDCLAL